MNGIMFRNLNLQHVQIFNLHFEIFENVGNYEGFQIFIKLEIFKI
jgi:hypothetical protein